MPPFLPGARETQVVKDEHETQTLRDISEEVEHDPPVRTLVDPATGIHYVLLDVPHYLELLEHKARAPQLITLREAASGTP